MFQALIFDFNGVLADDEPIHLEAFRSVALEEGIALTDEVYWERYLALDDWALFRALYLDNDRELSDRDLDALVVRKSEHYYSLLGEKPVLFEGAIAAIQSAAAVGPVAIASGARREEIDWILRSEQIARHFEVIVSAEDVTNGKPHPEPYLKALVELARRHGPLEPSQCLAVEDSRGGVQSAKASGLRCLAVEHSYDRSHLVEADWVLPSIRDFEQWIKGSVQ